MNRWVIRLPIILAAAAAVAVGLPMVRRNLEASRCTDRGEVYDRETRLCHAAVPGAPDANGAALPKPDAGSLVVGLAVGVAMVRLFSTLDRRRRRRQAAA